MKNITVVSSAVVSGAYYGFWIRGGFSNYNKASFTLPDMTSPRKLNCNPQKSHFCVGKTGRGSCISNSKACRILLKPGVETTIAAGTVAGITAAGIKLATPGALPPAEDMNETARRLIIRAEVEADLYEAGRKALNQGKITREGFGKTYQSRFDNFLAKPLSGRLLEVLPPKRNKAKANKQTEEEFSWRSKGQPLDSNRIRVLAAMTPTEVILHGGSPSLAKDFSMYAQRSGVYWKDTRTGTAFQLGDALKRELMEHDVARGVLKLKEDITPGTFANTPNIWKQL